MGSSDRVIDLAIEQSLDYPSRNDIARSLDYPSRDDIARSLDREIARCIDIVLIQ
jgi:hypothetical protein